MSSKELSREELFALVWENPTQEVARELGVSDVAIAKLCAGSACFPGQHLVCFGHRSLGGKCPASVARRGSA